MVGARGIWNLRPLVSQSRAHDEKLALRPANAFVRIFGAGGRTCSGTLFWPPFWPLVFLDLSQSVFFSRSRQWPSFDRGLTTVNVGASVVLAVGVGPCGLLHRIDVRRSLHRARVPKALAQDRGLRNFVIPGLGPRPPPPLADFKARCRKRLLSRSIRRDETVRASLHGHAKGRPPTSLVVST